MSLKHLCYMYIGISMCVSEIARLCLYMYECMFSMLVHAISGGAEHGEITWMSSSSVEGHRQLLQIDPAFISSL